MNSTGVLILLALAVVGLGPWLIRRIYDRTGSRELGNAPELIDFAPEERGKVWLGAICETLLQWQVMLGAVVVFGVAAAIIIVADDLVPEPWHGAFVFLVLMLVLLATRPLVVRRARGVVAAKLKGSNHRG